MSTCILIVGAGANQAPLIRHARGLGLRVVAMDGSADAPGLPLADAAVVDDITSAEAVGRAARAHSVSAVYPAAEWGVEAAAIAAAALGLPGPSPEAAPCLRNKHALRARLAAAAIPGPAFHAVATLHEAERAARDIGLPVIVKPASGNASRGVQRVDYIEDMSLAFAKAQAHAKGNEGAAVLVEAYMDGEEYNVDGLVHEGRFHLGGMTGKDRSALPYRFDRGIYMPPLFNADEEEAITACVSRALNAIGFQQGTVHAEVIVTASGPQIVEIAGRPGGGRIPTDLIPLVYGVDYVAASLDTALGRKPDLSPRHVRGAALYWAPTSSGVITAIHGLDEAAGLDGVVDLVMAARPGDVMRHVVDCVTRDRVGYVLTTGASAEEAIARAKASIARIQICTAPVV